MTDTGNIRYITVYRPPELNKLGRDYMALLIECLDYLCDTRDTVVLVGDLNLPNIDWFLLDCPADTIHSVFLEFCTQFGLYQFVDSPTRENHILDLVLSIAIIILCLICILITRSVLVIMLWSNSVWLLYHHQKRWTVIGIAYCLLSNSQKMLWRSFIFIGDITRRTQVTGSLTGLMTKWLPGSTVKSNQSISVLCNKYK